MDTTKKIIIVLILCFCISYSEAQNSQSASPQMTRQQTTLKRAQYVFEGTITHQESYMSKEHGILTCTTIQITKIFKGNPKLILGTIKVITDQGGRVGKYSSRVEDGGAALGKKGTCIIIGSQADSTMLNGMGATTTDNSPILTVYAVIEISGDVYMNGKLVEQAHAQWQGRYKNPGISFKSVNDMYTYLNENGLTIQVEQSQTTLPADSTKH
ncbi:MAG: hypothetical protein ACLQQ4_07310 [Bacteroidia bacterium]